MLLRKWRFKGLVSFVWGRWCISLLYVVDFKSLESTKRHIVLVLVLKFIVIDEKERVYELKSGGTRIRTKFTFICPVCGAYQKEKFISEFDF